jgi:membrane-bound metal-dependent hydrolase YbcI (DUF457 family)
MPRKPAHVAAGLAAGIGAGFATARHLPDEDQFLHVAFAGIGGAVGGLAPDWLEPGSNPNHRNVFHSLLAAGGITAAALADWQSSCHRASAECLSRAQLAPLGSSERSNEQMKAFLWRVLAGLIIGFLAGYASHLALDAGTAKSLPLLFNGF